MSDLTAIGNPLSNLVITLNDAADIMRRRRLRIRGLLSG